MQQTIPAALILENGVVMRGFSFGYEQSGAGEVVFNTTMIGYPEILTDPSCAGQILVATFPLVGNYGVPNDKLINGISASYESDHIQVSGLIMCDYSFDYSHWNAGKSLQEWLRECKIPAVYGIDTRELTKMLRDKGSLLGKIVIGEKDVPFYNPNEENQAAKVGCKEIMYYGDGEKKIVLVDCGLKYTMLRCLLKRNVQVIRVPWDYDFSQLTYDGLFISNGPGNPDFCGIAVEHIRRALNEDRPIFGVGMGNQLLAKAGGAKIFKLKYGHRSHNQPVRMLGTNKCFITSQNHGYSVDVATLGKDWEPLFENMNDGTNEGIRHKTKPFFSAQFHPAISDRPTDTELLFDDFLNLMNT